MLFQKPQLDAALQIGGVVQTGCHGSGILNRTVCELVTSMTVIDADGQLREFTRGGADPDIFEAAVCALGTFGVVYTITLQAVPNKWMLAEDKIFDRKSVLTDAAFLKEQVCHRIRFVRGRRGRGWFRLGS